MTLGAFITITNPRERGDLFDEAYASAKELCDEVVIVDGAATWPREFNWQIIGQHFQSGYEQCSTDWVLHLDCDFIIHQKNFSELRQAIQDNKNSPAISLYKWQFILPDRYNLKSRLVIAVNKGRYGDRIRFDSGGDLCQPSLDGKELSPDDVPQAGIPFYNYEKLLKTEAQIKDDVGRMARAWHSHFGEYKLGGPDDESAYAEWLHMSVGRFSKPQKHIALNEHPKFVQETIKNLKPENWGYSGFGNLEVNDYVKK